MCTHTHSHAHAERWMINKGGGTRRTSWMSDDIPNNDMSDCRVCVGLCGEVIALDGLLLLIAVVAKHYDAATAVH